MSTIWEALNLVSTLVIGGTFVLSGSLKLRAPLRETEQTLASLRVPRRFQRRWIAVLYPWGELVLGLLVVLGPAPLWFVAAISAFGLCLVLTVLVARVLRGGQTVACSCFGRPEPLTPRTLLRNVVLTAVAVAAAIPPDSDPLLAPAPMWRFGAGDADLVVAVLVTAGLVAAVVTLSHSPWVRMMPPAFVLDSTGQRVSLHGLVGHGPVLLVHLSDTCAACGDLAQRLVDGEVVGRAVVRVLRQGTPTVETATGLWDADAGVATAIGIGATPSAVLLMPDGTMPVAAAFGADEVSALLREVERAD